MINAKSWDEVRTRFNAIVFNESFDMIVAIANGGIVPAAIINQRLQLPMVRREEPDQMLLSQKDFLFPLTVLLLIRPL